MDIVIKGRNVEIPEHYRTHVADKLTRLERYDRKVIRFDVELFHEPNRRQAKNCQRVEITGKGRGPIVRAEARAGDFYAALDSAISKLESRLRRMHDRRRVHYGRRSPESLAEATAAAAQAVAANGATPTGTARAATAVLDAPTGAAVDEDVPTDEMGVPEPRWDDGVAPREPGRIVREKQHSAEPMTIDDALYQMELVGHDFYLFHDAECDKASVVYRRKGFDYGVIRLG
ncbi:ribosome hibernation-promoting factor, HPF/YfiA family [Saccharomonospora piscinae]|uniref:Ribosome hibernation promoting factor n=1 Tax=Saccharomonospora piscinae TaxID=687388 RepID=A0A1V9A5R7_SACPI|nr:ribosome-associated translation inhibitor RaiA [Saccharomonospora piscinae]OQO92376.1 ribosomal subunit interface protein [Saccharomonospora piscinae]TLW91908.1 ribosome-associated translation inhibitor RaiA [Saccharomonospora piscinae]